MSASSWCSLGWPNFPDPPDDHLIALETNATRSGEFGSIRLKSLAKCSKTNTKNVITQLKVYHVIAAEYRYYTVSTYLHVTFEHITGYQYLHTCFSLKINKPSEYSALTTDKVEYNNTYY